jgi:hypothetical protein
MTAELNSFDPQGCKLRVSSAAGDSNEAEAASMGRRMSLFSFHYPHWYAREVWKASRQSQRQQLHDPGNNKIGVTMRCNPVAGASGAALFPMHPDGHSRAFGPCWDSMRRTEVLDGVRMLKFRDVFGRCEQGRLSKFRTEVPWDMEKFSATG